MNNILITPTRLYSVMNNPARNAGDVGPLLNCFGFTVGCKQVIAARVVRLLLTCRPLEIVRAVTLAVILPVKRRSDWWITNILKKVREGVPSLANLYSSRPVVFIPFVIRVVTPPKHSRPAPVDACSNHSMFAVFEVLDISVKASARLGCSISEVAPLDGYSVAAITEAFPLRVAAIAGHKNQSLKPSKSLAGKINEIVGALDRIVCGCYDFCRFIHSYFMIGFSGGLLLTERPSASYNPSSFSESQRLVNG